MPCANVRGCVGDAGPEMGSYQGHAVARPFCLFQALAGTFTALGRALASVYTALQALPGPWGPPARPGPVSVSRALVGGISPW